MKVMFLLGMYHPKYSANGLCCKNVIDECINRGWDVSCVVNSYNGNMKSYEFEGAKIYPIKPRLTYRITEWCDIHNSSKCCKLLSKLASLLNKLKLAIRSYSWPYISPSYTQAFYHKARELELKENFDVVIAAYTPIDSLYAGYKLKCEFETLKFVAYYLDALAGGWGPVKWSEKKRDQRLRKWELLISEKADAIFSMESSRVYHTANPLPSNLNKKRYYLDVPMMLPSAQTAKADEGIKKYALFAGDISYPRRNPIPLLEAFTSVCIDNDLQLVFVGPCNNTDIFTPYIEKTNGRIRLLGKKTHSETLELEQGATFLVNIGSENPYTIPCKIFEYMRFKKPIISTYAIDDEPSMMCLKKYGFAHFIDERKPATFNQECLKSFIEKNEVVDIPDDFCQQIFYKNTPKAFADTLEKIMEE